MCSKTNIAWESAVYEIANKRTKHSAFICKICDMVIAFHIPATSSQPETSDFKISTSFVMSVDQHGCPSLIRGTHWHLLNPHRFEAKLPFGNVSHGDWDDGLCQAASPTYTSWTTGLARGKNPSFQRRPKQGKTQPDTRTTNEPLENKNSEQPQNLPSVRIGFGKHKCTTCNNPRLLIRILPCDGENSARQQKCDRHGYMG